MSDKIKFLWQYHHKTFLAFIAALAVTAFFIIRMAVFTLYWSDPDHRNQPPAPWMTPRYIAYSWGVEPVDIATALGVAGTIGKRPSLKQIAQARGVPVSVVLSEVTAILTALGAQQ